MRSAIFERPPQFDSLLEARKINVNYGAVAAVSDVSIRVKPGQIVTVIGPNGAGKSSLMMALMGAVDFQGDIDFYGLTHSTSLNESGIGKRIAHRISLVPETRALFAGMSVEDNLALGSFPVRHESKYETRSRLEEVYSIFPRLRERAKQEASTLSGGERQMLALGRALMGKPKFLMLDEPSLGLAPLIVREIFRVLVGLRDRGVSILLVEQNAMAALQIADYAYVMELGKVTMEGCPADIENDPRIMSAYLGSSVGHQASLSR